MTPYAFLLVKPTDSDEVIRKAYHRVAQENHPDRAGGDGKPGSLWFTSTAAYTAIKTEEVRSVWMQKQELLSGFCDDCSGSGVQGTRLFKGRIKVCEVCKGKGRIV